MSPLSFSRNVGAQIAAALIAGGVGAGLWYATHARPSVVDWTAIEVPAARELLVPHGVDFVLSGRGNLTTDAHREGASFSTTAPALADAAFELTAAGGGRSAKVSLAGASPVTGRVDRGTAVYANAYKDVDVVAVPATEGLEVLYVLRSFDAASALALHVAKEDGDTLRVEPVTDAAIVVAKDGRTRMRIAPPVAIDAKGRVRRGKYSIGQDDVSIAMNYAGLEAPVVVDPMVTFPLWTILDDGRGPGSVVYDTRSASREMHLAKDSTRNRVVGVRPIRSQQPADSLFLFGEAARFGFELDGQSVSSISLGTSGRSLQRESDEWTRGFWSESETWEWDGSAWTMNTAAHLPGFIDPALTFDSVRGRVVLYGGASPGLQCSPYYSGGPPFLCVNNDAVDVTYEYDGALWSPRKIPGSPTPRLRASFAFDASTGRAILFGGREVETRNSQRQVDAYGPVFPDNLTRDLLNDTWAYDGSTWRQIAAGSPPAAREGAQLVADARRNVMVLVGGRTASELNFDTDHLTISEFDGTDWIEKVTSGDPRLPLPLRTRRGMTAFWNPTRQRVTITGGTTTKMESCSLSDAEIAQRTTAALNDANARAAVGATGCVAAYVHDQWEWDGTSFTKTADAAFGGMVGTEPVYQQIAGASSWSTVGAAPAGPNGLQSVGTTPLLPWRYDARDAHFALRSVLERAHAPTPTGATTAPVTAPSAPSQSTTATAFSSPLFAARIHGEAFFDSARGVLQMFVPETSAVYDLDGATVIDRTVRTSPFSAGDNDFFGATWDGQNQRIVLFDPTTGVTWFQRDGEGWSRAGLTNNPPTWSLPSSVRMGRDLAPPRFQAGAPAFYSPNVSLASALQQAPRMAFDRARGRVLMIYGDATWQLDGDQWTSTPLPPALTSCVAAIDLAFDGARSRAVAFGCTVPAQTWEFDGAAWTGPGPSPYTDLVARDFAGSPSPLEFRIKWNGTAQLAYSHPNAAFESKTLGGVSMIDAAGTLKTWNGTTWLAGPTMPTGHACVSTTYFANHKNPFPVLFNSLTGEDFLPSCFFPPAIEDASNQRIIAFRDGLGMQKVALGSVAASDRAWTPLELGSPDSEGVRVNPYPFELMTPEHVALTTQTDPASRIFDPSVPPPSLPADNYKVGERDLRGLVWSYRLLQDSASGRIRMLTHRGLVWELGGQAVRGLGDACQSDGECSQGACSRTEKVCCDNPYCTDTVCMTCKGSTPGTCNPVPAGQHDVIASDATHGCGSGECAGTCPGTNLNIPRSSFLAYGVCRYDSTRTCGAAPSCSSGQLTPRAQCSSGQAICGAPVAQSCPAGLGCTSDGTQCKATCTTRLDCGAAPLTCNAVAGACVPDQASVAASARGVVPAVFTPPPLRSATEIADELRDAGLPTDDAGRIILSPADDLGGVALAYDPNLKTPILGLRKCLHLIEACMVMTTKADECVAAASRCTTPTPWLGDPAGDDCCPEACLTTYFETRATKDEGTSLQSFLTSGCYLPAQSDAGAP